MGLGIDDELDAQQREFMKAVNDPSFQASLQPITIAEADRLRQNFIGLNQQVNLLLQKVTELRQTTMRLTAHVDDLETEAKQLREHYKVFAEFKAEVLDRLETLESRLTYTAITP